MKTIKLIFTRWLDNFRPSMRRKKKALEELYNYSLDKKIIKTHDNCGHSPHYKVCEACERGDEVDNTYYKKINPQDK